MLKHYTTIGIWGLGIVGRSLVNFIKKHYPTLQIIVLDRKTIMPDDKLFLEQHEAYYYSELQTDTFLEKADIIIPSPGIDLRPHLMHKDKFITELDLFCFFWKKPIIAITGTLGKTTLTHLSYTILGLAGKKVVAGGNIGTPLMALIDEQENYDIAAVELSSFQLEHAQNLQASWAIITNIYPNHLDRHTTFIDYKQAKFKVFQTQMHQQAIIPFEYYHELKRLYPSKSWIVHSERPLTQEEYCEINLRDSVYYVENGLIKKIVQGRVSSIFALPEFSYPTTWVILHALLDLFNVSIDREWINKIALPDHRLAYVGTFDGCAFFDDSKSTIIQATYAAVEKLQEYQVILLLGGISKGVDRLQSIHLLKNKIVQLICFGSEAPELVSKARENTIDAQAFSTLEEAFDMACKSQAAYKKPAILLSPGGASFDLFSDYKARGHRFKQLIYERAWTANVSKS